MKLEVRLGKGRDIALTCQETDIRGRYREKLLGFEGAWRFLGGRVELQVSGVLQQVSKGSRPNITYIVRQLSQHYSEPIVQYQNTILRVMQYLKSTINYSISYNTGKAQSLKLQGFSNTDYTGNIVNRRSTIGHLYLLNRGPITWSSIK